MKIPYWVEKTIWGGFICLSCGSLVLQLVQGWTCTDPSCPKHDDMPIEQQRGFAGWNVTTTTTSGTSSPSTSTTTTI